MILRNTEMSKGTGMYGEIRGCPGEYWEIRVCSKNIRGDTRMSREILGNLRMSKGTERSEELEGDIG